MKTVYLHFFIESHISPRKRYLYSPLGTWKPNTQYLITNFSPPIPWEMKVFLFVSKLKSYITLPMQKRLFHFGEKPSNKLCQIWNQEKQSNPKRQRSQWLWQEKVRVTEIKQSFEFEGSKSKEKQLQMNPQILYRTNTVLF